MNLSFDWFVGWICDNTPYIGKYMRIAYFDDPRVQRFIKYAFILTLQFWGLRAPLVWLLTEYLKLHYLLSSFSIGVFLAVLGFIWNEFWIWREE